MLMISARELQATYGLASMEGGGALMAVYLAAIENLDQAHPLTPADLGATGLTPERTEWALNELVRLGYLRTVGAGYEAVSLYV